MNNPIELQVLKSNIPWNLRHFAKMQKKKKYKCWLPLPPSLVTAAGNIVNDFPMPVCWKWDIDDVIKWLRNTIKLPQYKDCFIKNYINGRRLITVNASVCPQIGIYDFQHIKRITQGICTLCKMKREEYKKCVSLLPRHAWIHYLLYKVPTGPTREYTKATELFTKMGIINEQISCLLNHWERINPEQPEFPRYCISSDKRKHITKHGS